MKQLALSFILIGACANDDLSLLMTPPSITLASGQTNSNSYGKSVDALGAASSKAVAPLSDEIISMSRTYELNSDMTIEEAQRVNEISNSIRSNTFSSGQDTELLASIEVGTSNLECKYGNRDYSQPCAQDFSLVGPFCIPQRKYNGVCMGFQATKEMSTEQKQAWSKRCGAKWECAPDVCLSGSDYSVMCPLGWFEVGEGTCEAPIEFQPSQIDFNNNGCARRVQFGAYTAEMKSEFEKRCFSQWPCNNGYENNCKINYDRTCPHGWMEVAPFVCEAPLSYTGPCPIYANMTDYLQRPDLKRNFEYVCGVSFPCTVDCQRDWSILCPLGWKMLPDKTCVAPPFLTMPSKLICSRRKDFSTSDFSIKAAFAQECRTDWPCADRSTCERDFSSRCPVGWSDDANGSICTAPRTYTGTCRGSVPLSGWTDKQKAIFSIKCGVDWPCVGEYSSSLQLMHRSA